eukprot:m.41384 g.41384  ORF g.41384 m.41384 type:complete len:69 (-) comp46144_c0_seq2:27-233(-)
MHFDENSPSSQKSSRFSVNCGLWRDSVHPHVLEISSFADTIPLYIGSVYFRVVLATLIVLVSCSLFSI